ncbi:serine/threonine-protein kinase [Dokdonella sp.]|uniref:serine/threonine-protein kinase n=1 Tax=Dokdonella sp. TaxID=2291710 RepID=UPI0025B89188|nr:serine/threonine-protein kinase [Dokdonella sp.]MBX3692808.1 tetratricopeptide repeat protein [Dokdonella sp.]
MDPRALSLLEQALDQPRDARERFLHEAAGASPSLLQDALALLRAHGESEGRFEPEALPARIGDWRVLERLGSGGMGEVFLAEREGAGFRQRAALKLSALGIGGAAAVARFHAERQFLARFEHPNIAHVIDGGSAADGRPYVAMEYVDGEPIDRWCANRRLALRERVLLFLQVIAAVEAAHRALILHRDIKPANVMVTAEGQVKLLDFGIAKSLAGEAGLTGTGFAPLTPQFASPEQLAGEPLTTASDVFALGLLLHLLLTGRHAFEHAGQSTAQALAHMRRQAPTRPSARIDAAALALLPRDLRHWRSLLSGDLDRVLLKALAADPERRYASAAALGEDLGRWLASRPVSARQGDALYRARLFVRRNALAVTSAGAAALALAIGLGIAAHQAWQVAREAARAESARAFLLALIADANPVVSGREPTLKEALDQALPRIPDHFRGQADSEADVRLGIGLAYTNLMQLDAAEAQFARALALRTPGTRGWAEVLQARALLAWTRGRTDAAEADYRAALEVFSADPALLRDAGEVQNDLASLLSDLGRFEEAVAFARASVASGRRLAIDDGALGARLENLGSALQGLGRLDQSEQTYREAIERLGRALPQRTVAYAIALNNFALVQRDRGDREEALSLFQRAAQVREQAFGPDHADLAGSLINAARLQAELGRIDDAKASAARAVALAERAFAPDYIGRGHVHLGAARVALAAGDLAGTQRHAEAALAVFERADSAAPQWLDQARELLRAAAGKPGDQGDETSAGRSTP